MAAVATPSHDALAKPPTTDLDFQSEKEINSINDFIVHQARSIPDKPLIAYPASELGAADFENYTAKDLDAFADEAAKALASQGLIPKVKQNT
jgi:hypothetical protein